MVEDFFLSAVFWSDTNKRTMRFIFLKTCPIIHSFFISFLMICNYPFLSCKICVHDGVSHNFFIACLAAKKNLLYSIHRECHDFHIFFNNFFFITNHEIYRLKSDPIIQSFFISFLMICNYVFIM